MPSRRMSGHQQPNGVFSGNGFVYAGVYYVEIESSLLSFMFYLFILALHCLNKIIRNPYVFYSFLDHNESVIHI